MRFYIFGYELTILKCGISFLKVCPSFNKTLNSERKIKRYAKKVSEWEFDIWLDKIKIIKEIRSKWRLSLKSAADVYNMARTIQDNKEE